MVEGLGQVNDYLNFTIYLWIIAFGLPIIFFGGTVLDKYLFPISKK